MSDAPDLQTVQGIAFAAMLLSMRQLRDASVNVVVFDYGVPGLGEESFLAYRNAAVAEYDRLYDLLPTALTAEPGEQPTAEQDGAAARIAELEREVRQLRAGAPRAWRQDLRTPVGRFENFVNATRSYDSDHLGGIMRGGNAEATITLGDLRAVLAQLAELEAAQAEQDGDVRAVRALTNATGRMLSKWAEADDAVRREMWTEVHDRADDVDERFRERFAELDAAQVALDARDADGSAN